jgi:hypothetical protein
MLYINDHIRFAPDGGGSTGEGPEPSPPPSNPTEPPGAAAGAGDDEAAKLRAEAAKWRVQLREAQSQLKELQPAAARLAELEEANKTDAQKQADRLAKLEADLRQAQVTAELATKRSKLTVLATKAGVSADVVDFLDVGKFDLDNEEATLKALQALARPSTEIGSANSRSGGGPSNPGRSGDNGVPSAEEWYKQQTGKKTSIFGG